jgi:hypothetical protein
MRYGKNIVYLTTLLTFIIVPIVLIKVFSSRAIALGNISATIKISVCGNGVIEGGEDCEGDDLGGATCESLGYAGGILSCDYACSFDTFNCLAPTPTPTPTPTQSPGTSSTPTPDSTLTSAPTSTAITTSTPTPTPTSAPTAATPIINIKTTTSPTPADISAPTQITSDRLPRLFNYFDINEDGRIEIKEVFEGVKLWAEEKIYFWGPKILDSFKLIGHSIVSFWQKIFFK